MIKCTHCKNVIEMGKSFVKIQFIGDFCNEDCSIGFIKDQIKKSGLSYIKEDCEHCYNCCENTDNSMFGTNTTQKCKLDENIDCENMDKCKSFIYGEPEKYDFTHNRNGGKTTTNEAIKYIKE